MSGSRVIEVPNSGFINFPRQGASLIISGGIVTAYDPYISVDTEGSAATDDLDTINAPTSKTGDRIVIRSNNNSRVVVLKDGTGNLRLNSDLTLDSVFDTIELIKEGTGLSGTWRQIGFSNNA